MSDLPRLLDLAAIRALYAGGCSVQDVIAAAARRAEDADPSIFITRSPAAYLMAAVEALLARAPEPGSLPLWGVPFAVKDNIDVAGLPTTCACPAFSHVAEADAAVVQKLIEAGAIVIGKTNLDQFATGLNGTRSPYGIPRSVFDPAFISGGSSSGSAVAVAAGIVCFSLGTDTAGSGRVPAAFNNIVGIKPTSGLLSTRGLVPACESLDCISVFALSTADGVTVRRLAEGYDPADPWSRIAEPRTLPRDGLRLGVLALADRDFCGRSAHAALYAQAIARTGAEVVEIDYAPFREVAALLYEGAWVAERLAAFEDTGVSIEALDPVVGGIFARAASFSATDAFRGLHRLETLNRRCQAEFDKADVLLLPTAPRTFTVEEMLAEPVLRNSQLGLYTNFCNLLGLSAIAVPAGFAADGLPFGVTLVGPGFADDSLARLADRVHRASDCGCATEQGTITPPLPPSADPEDRIELVVVGAHLSDMPLNHELVALGGQLAARTRSSPEYRLFALPGTVPPKPGLVFSPGANGPGIEVEVWSMPAAGFGRFVAAIPGPLGVGRIKLANGRSVSGFLCEQWASEGAEECTQYGGWRAYVANRATVLS